MASKSFPKAEIEKCLCIQSNPTKWKGLLIGSLTKIVDQVHPLLAASDEALECVEMLIVQCLEIITLRSSPPHTVLDIKDQVKRWFPKPIDKWAIKDANEAIEKNKKKHHLILPTNKIHNLMQKELLQYKLDYPVALYITAVLEYMAADILKLAGNYVNNIHRVEISYQDLCIAICGDKVLMDLFSQHDNYGNLNLSELGIDKIQRITTYEEVIKDLMHDEKQLVRDLYLILKVFKEEINRFIPVGTCQKLDDMFNNITDICKTTKLFLSSIEDILEIADDKSALVGCCIEEFAENAEFYVFECYANDIVNKQCRNVFWNLISKLEVSNSFKLPGFKEALKYYFPKLLLLPLWHCILYFDYFRILHQLSPSQHDKICLEQAESMFKPLRFKMVSFANKINLKDNVREFGLKINATPSRLLAIEKLKKAIDGLDGKDMVQCCTEFIREGILLKVSNRSKKISKRYSERKAILFNGVLLLCKSNSRMTSVSVSSQLVGSLSEFKFNLKEKLFIRKMEIIDRDDTEEIKHSFEIVTHLQPPVTLVARTFEDKANWMADLIMLSTKNILDRTLNNILLDENKKIPLRLPSIEEYRFVEPDSQSNIIFEEKENNGIPLIKGAILLKLIERLTYHMYADPKFVKTFLTIYRSFCSPHVLMDLLIERYKIPEPFGITMNSESLQDETKRFKKEYLVPVQFRVLNVFRHWVNYHYYDYQCYPYLLDKLHRFLDSINGKSMKIWADSLIKIIHRKSSEAQKEIIFAFDSPPPAIEVHVNFNGNEEFNILLVHPLEFARQLTLIESENYRAVKPSELVGSVWTKKNKEINSPHLLRLIKRTTNFSRWIEKTVVECENIEERVAIVSRFIEVMMALYQLNNFNGVLGVLSAMRSAAVFRLKFTMESVSHKFIEALENAQNLSNNHFKKYHDRLRSINPPCVPFIGMYLTNILHIEEGNSDYLTNNPNLINFNKRRKVAEIIEEIQQYQNQPYCLNVEPKIKKFLENLNPFSDMKDTEISNYLYDKSLEIEPKNCKQLPKYPRKWPNLNLKSPGLKHKSRVPSISSKDTDAQGKKKLSSSSPVIQMDKTNPDNSTFAPISFTFGKNSHVPPVPPRLSKIYDGSFKPPIPPRKIAPPLRKEFHFIRKFL